MPRSKNAIPAGLSSLHHQPFDLARHPEKAKATYAQIRPIDRPLAKDFIDAAEFDLSLRAWFGNTSRVPLPGRVFYIWGGYAIAPPVLAGSASAAGDAFGVDVFDAAKPEPMR